MPFVFGILYPEGILENSPAFQRWDRVQERYKSRMGRLNRMIDGRPSSSDPTRCAYLGAVVPSPGPF